MQYRDGGIHQIEQNDLFYKSVYGARAHSPSHHQSKAIIKDVFTNMIPLPSSPSQSLYLSRIRSPEPAAKAIQFPTLPPNLSPSARAAHYLKYLDHEQYEVALLALEEIRRLVPQCKGGFEIVRQMSQVLRRFPSLLPSFTLLLVDTISLFVTHTSSPPSATSSPHGTTSSSTSSRPDLEGVEWQEALEVVARVLLDESISHPVIHRASIRCLIKMGYSGISLLIEFATTSGFGSLQELVLNTLASQPLIQEFTVMKMIKRELIKTSDARVSAVMAVSRLYDKALPFLPLLIEMFEKGVVSRDILAHAIRNCGEPGEKVLIDLLQNPNYRIRACAAVALGQLLIVNPSYLFMYENKMMNAPPSSPTYLSNGEEITGIEWDGREFAGMMNMAMQEGLLPPIHDPIDFNINNNNNVINNNNHNDSTTNINNNNSSFNNSNSSFNSSTNSKSSASISFPMSSAVVNALSFSLSNDTSASSLMNADPSMAHIIHSALIKALGDSTPAVREQAAKTIGAFGKEMNTRDIISPLTALLRDEFYQVRHSACLALGKIGESGEGLGGSGELQKEEVLPELLRVLIHNTVNRANVATSIASFGEEAEEELMRVVSTPLTHSTVSRSSSISALSCINLDTISVQRGENIVNCFYNNSKDSNPSIRIACLQALSQLAPKHSQFGQTAGQSTKPLQSLQSTRILPFMYGMLNDKEPTVRECAAEQMALLYEEGGELLLVEGLLKDSSSLTREASAHGLAIIGPRSTRSLLLALSDQEERVKEAAGQALQGIGIQRILSDLPTRPRHYLESLAHFCDAVLASPAYARTITRNTYSPTQADPRRSQESRRNSVGSQDGRRSASPTRRTTHAPRGSDLRAFLETLRTQVVTIARLK